MEELVRGCSQSCNNSLYSFSASTGCDWNKGTDLINLRRFLSSLTFSLGTPVLRRLRITCREFSLEPRA